MHSETEKNSLWWEVKFEGVKDSTRDSQLGRVWFPRDIYQCLETLLNMGGGYWHQGGAGQG